MSSAQPDPKYFPYSTYAHFKNKFNPYYGITYDENKLDVFIKKSINRNIEELKYKDVFKELLRHLANTGAVSFGDTDAACKYVSYILRKEIQKVDEKTYDDNIFSVFQKFAQAFKEDKGISNPECETKMVNIDSSVFPKMKALYDIYDMYYTIKTTPDYKVTERCNGLGKLIREYNTALEMYDNNDDYVIKKLLHIKEITEKLDLLPPEKCQYRISHLESPKLYFKRLENERIQKEQEELAQKERMQKEQEELAQKEKLKKEQEELAQRELEKQEVRATLESSRVPPDNLSVLGTPENDISSSTLHAREKGLSANSISSREQPFLGGNKFTDSQTSYSHLLWGQREELQQSDLKNQELENNHISETDTPGVFGSLQNSLSSFIREVEPAPVLGVSGGMGALFLLFKYTPVGSFFGGRRRRMHQIPRTFGRFPPGEFPNFHEYDGGFIGYAPMNINPLAE